MCKSLSCKVSEVLFIHLSHNYNLISAEYNNSLTLSLKLQDATLVKKLGVARGSKPIHSTYIILPCSYKTRI